MGLNVNQSSLASGAEKHKNTSPAGNRTPVFRVTGGDTHHYTTEEAMRNNKIKFVRFPSAYDHTTLNAPVLV